MAPVHDPRTCPVCGPLMATEAWRRGEARARAMHPTAVVPSPLMQQLAAGTQVDLEPHLEVPDAAR